MKGLKDVIRVMHHDDPPCETRLDNGYCPDCKFVPDMQSLALWSYCKACQVPLEGILKLQKEGGGFEKGIMKCPKCKETFDLRPEEKKNASKAVVLKKADKKLVVPKILGVEKELRGRKTTMQIVDVDFGDKKWKYEIVRRPDAACAIVETQRGQKFIFIKQYRIPVEAELFEAVAGCVEDGEDPEDCINREVEEETGYKVKTIDHLVSFYASPGYSNEILHAYYVTVDDVAGEQRPDDDERIKVVSLNYQQVKAIMDADGLKDAHTLIAWREACKKYNWE